VATNQFSGAGTFSFSAPIDGATPQQFFRLQLP
jgi:hypothetical protein